MKINNVKDIFNEDSNIYKEQKMNRVSSARCHSVLTSGRGRSTSASTKNIKVKIDEKKQELIKKLKRRRSVSKNLRQNFNNYRHLLMQKVPIPRSELEWSTDLRDYRQNGNGHQETNEYETNNINDQFSSGQKKHKNPLFSIGPPSFYHEDLQKFLEKVEKERKKIPNSKIPMTKEKDKNRRLLNFLIKSKFNRPLTLQKINYALNLRAQPKLYSGFVNPKEWNDHSQPDHRNILPLEEKSKEEEKHIIRPYTIVREEANVAGQSVKRKKLVRCKSEAEVWMGEHTSNPKYNDRFKEKNMAKIDFLVTKKNKCKVSEINFIVGFRNYKGQNEFAEKIKKERQSKSPGVKQNKA